MKTEFMNLYEELNTLNEVFTYKEEELLSEEELKEITAKVAELESKYEETNSAWRAKIKELEAAGVKFIGNVEARELANKSYELWKQLSPLKKKLDRHNEILKYKSTADSQLATEEDWDRFISYEWDVEVEDLEVEVYVEEDDYPSGWSYSSDSIIWGSSPAQYGTINNWTVSVEVTKEQVAEFLNKKVEEVTTKDLMDLDEKEFTNYLSTLDEVIDKAIEEATEAADSGDYDYDRVSWND